MIRKFLFAASLASVMAVPAWAECTYKPPMPLRAITQGFPAWKVLAKSMESCGNVEVETTQNSREKQVPAFQAKPPLYQIAGVDTADFTALYEGGLLRPLDDLIAKYGKDLKPNRLIKFDGKTYAIGVFMNTQHLVYREDILKQLNIPVPKTWDEVLAAAEKIKQAKLVAYPLGATMKSGWNIAQEFITFNIGYGGKFLNDDGTPAIDSDAGRKALAEMKKISAYLDPEYLVSEATYVQRQFQAGKIAMANSWASRIAALDDPKESKIVGKAKGAMAPLAMKGGMPTATLMWYGFVIAKNATEDQAEAAFKMIVASANTDVAKANNDLAIWLIDGFKPGPAAIGAIETAEANPPPPFYPSSSRMGVLHTALGQELPAFMTGQRDAEATLKAITAKYLTSAKEAGLIR